MEKQQKKQLKVCKKEIKKSNIAVRGFMRSNKYRKGSYRKLQHTNIWSIAKRQLLHYFRLKGIKLICFYCKTEILSKPILHHKSYNWKALFNPNNIAFLHKDCHEQLHKEKRGYKKGTWKKILKAMLRAF